MSPLSPVSISKLRQHFTKFHKFASCRIHPFESLPPKYGDQHLLTPSLSLG